MKHDNKSSMSLANNPKKFLETLEHPALLIQGAPRQVVTANNKACKVFSKELGSIEGFRGGQVFDCVHAFSEDGCGLDTNCENCKIKNAVVNTFSTGTPHHNVRTILDIQKDDEIIPHDVHVSTEKSGDFVLLAVTAYRITP